MPWRPEDAPRHTHKADTAHLCRLWAEVANSVLAETGDDGHAIRAANAAVAREGAAQAMGGSLSTHGADRRATPRKSK
jgi:hypothetical protein